MTDQEKQPQPDNVQSENKSAHGDDFVEETRMLSMGEDEVEEETVEEPADDMVDADMEGGIDLDAGSDEAKNAFDELTDAYRSAKELG
ncbi:MAG: hypothetical protein R3207_08815, partial [Oceanospirillum sp.]|nr:hypothetical protein [Oceanospirillum sp.]